MPVQLLWGALLSNYWKILPAFYVPCLSLLSVKHQNFFCTQFAQGVYLLVLSCDAFSAPNLSPSKAQPLFFCTFVPRTSNSSASWINEALVVCVLYLVSDRNDMFTAFAKPCCTWAVGTDHISILGTQYLNVSRLLSASLWWCYVSFQENLVLWWAVYNNFM